VEICAWEAPREQVEEEGCQGAEEEAVGEGAVDLLAEELAGTLEMFVSCGVEIRGRGREGTDH
jgi:hypothetical protein